MRMLPWIKMMSGGDCCAWASVVRRRVAVRVKGFTSGVYQYFELRPLPPPLQGYFAGKCFGWSGLRGGCSGKILITGCLRLKYLFCCGCRSVSTFHVYSGASHGSFFEYISIISAGRRVIRHANVLD